MSINHDHIVKNYVSDSSFPSRVVYSDMNQLRLQFVEGEWFYNNNEIIQCKSETGTVIKKSDGFVIDFGIRDDTICYL